MRIRLRYIALLLLLAALASGGMFAARMMRAWSGPGPLQQEKLVYIPPGSGGKAVAAQLAREGVTSDALAFRVLAKLQRGNGDLKAGEYKFTPGMTMGDAVALLQSGKTYQHKITIPEGLTSAEITALVNAAEAMTGTAEAPPEGALLPETYSYSYNDSRISLLDRMQKAMQDTVTSLWAARAESPLLNSPQEAVTLASVVEKETGLARERPRVAGVFMNRLKAGMPLQSDPTVIYAITLGKKKLDRPLSRADLTMDSPWNTYVKPGLPPGPIANPGRASLEAVLHPEANDYLFFVADGSGGHAFAATLKEHERNVTKWRKIEKEK
jgi:UPF0755 protein